MLLYMEIYEHMWYITNRSEDFVRSGSSDMRFLVLFNRTSEEGR